MKGDYKEIPLRLIDASGNSRGVQDVAKDAALGNNVEANAVAIDVYSVLADHQRTEDWNKRTILTHLQEWAGIFIAQFELHVTERALFVDTLPVSRLGHFRRGHNGQGLKGEIAINARYLSDLAEWEVLGVLLHELLHADEFERGTYSTDNHHNRQYRDKAASLGLIIGPRGVTGFAAASRFRDLLAQRGIAMPEGEIPPRNRRRSGDSKMKKWSCGCTNVRCAISNLTARCLKCDRMFMRADAGRASSRSTTEEGGIEVGTREITMFPEDWRVAQ